MKTSKYFALATVLTTGVASAQSQNMMNGGMWDGAWMGGYGGAWGTILLVVVVAALVAWIVQKKGK